MFREVIMRGCWCWMHDLCASCTRARAYARKVRQEVGSLEHSQGPAINPCAPDSVFWHFELFFVVFMFFK